jgi:ABC-type multidrug transport system fused ATPase/permease subunit
MLKDAPILLLDEATSALDSRWKWQSSLDTLMEGKTVMRLRTGCPPSRRWTMSCWTKAAVVEEGDHRSLLAAGSRAAVGAPERRVSGRPTEQG